MKKSDRELVRLKYDNRCAYCGDPLQKGWHVDEILPCIRLYEWTKAHWRHKITKEPKPKDGTARLMDEVAMADYEYIESRNVLKGYQYPERLHIDNQNPSCASCNINKHGGTIEEFRQLIQGFTKHLNENNTQFKISKRYGLVYEIQKPVVFYFETLKKSRCCGRCDGVNDICVGDMTCEAHSEMGCEICYGSKD